jgi:hypothetical protein
MVTLASKPAPRLRVLAVVAIFAVVATLVGS